MVDDVDVQVHVDYYYDTARLRQFSVLMQSQFTISSVLVLVLLVFLVLSYVMLMTVSVTVT